MDTPKFNTGCPQCGNEQHCPCFNCAERNKGKITWKWDTTGEIISCGYCGYTNHADGWMDIELSRIYPSTKTI